VDAAVVFGKEGRCSLLGEGEVRGGSEGQRKGASIQERFTTWVVRTRSGLKWETRGKGGLGGPSFSSKIGSRVILKGGGFPQFARISGGREVSDCETEASWER